ncbi:uncharacterized protein BP5553_07781 [Venustampulla echinocandica]|uniref:Uncharacterized protein n=1 Tax=Venustampulla echinocandica TaxID=2656787 RepID=A0A370THH7_9HELO|nr:uncharacterized protein BP5553_07781 [Venustampulla echinocandica]RDL34653.1 hypothetical protein BP5553_07781 [Venustampulla echinocandica]
MACVDPFLQFDDQSFALGLQLEEIEAQPLDYFEAELKKAHFSSRGPEVRFIEEAAPSNHASSRSSIIRIDIDHLVEAAFAIRGKSDAFNLMRWREQPSHIKTDGYLLSGSCTDRLAIDSRFEKCTVSFEIGFFFVNSFFQLSHGAKQH